MEIEFYGNRLKLENNEIYKYKKNKRGYYWHKIIFSINNSGYLYCELTNNKIQRKFLFHRLIYYFHNLDFDILNPKLVIDHINRDTLNNSIENLRKVSKQQNTFNSNAKGCYYNKKSGKWMAQITISGKYIYLGLHNTEEEAHEVYLEAKKKYHIITQSNV
jgi:hypothetical protein